MKAKAGLTVALAVLSGLVPAAFAAGGREDNSPLVVWAFIGFCALIVVAQLVPAILSGRRAAAAEKERAAAARAVKVPVQK